MKILGVIPSRYESSRFPGKPLVEINGRTMIQRVYEQSIKAECLYDVIVATDDDRIYTHVKSFGGNVVMTSSEHGSGTERCNEVLSKVEDTPDVVVNIQGDEPFIDPAQIEELCACFSDPKTKIATLIKRVASKEELFNPNRPKVDVDASSFAKMFSRSAIPVLNALDKEDWFAAQPFFKHIGIYAYKSEILNDLCSLSPSPLEKKERLEQLRWLENGYAIKVAETKLEAIAIDTPEDLKKITFK